MIVQGYVETLVHEEKRKEEQNHFVGEGTKFESGTCASLMSHPYRNIQREDELF
jgi:hypothetical protein